MGEIPRFVRGKPKYVSEAGENIPQEELEQIVLRWSPKSRARVVDAFKAWLIRVKEASKKGESDIFVINGEWGVGKTVLRRTLIKDIAKEYGFLIKEIRFDDFMRDVKAYSNLADYLFAFESALRKYIEEAGGVSEETPLLVFIDEVEGVIGLQRRQEKIGEIAAHEAFIDFLRNLRTKESPFAFDLKGKVHLVLFTTPHALVFIRRLLGLSHVGWLSRREHIYNLYPLNKLETIDFSRSFLEYLMEKKIHEIINDQRLLELFYTITNGNIGMLVKILSVLLNNLYTKCTERHGEDCVYTLDYMTLLEALKYTQTLKDFEIAITPINYEVVNKIEKRIDKELRDVLIKMISTSSIIRENELGKISLFVLKHLKTYLGLEVIRFRIYKLDDIEDVLRDLETELSADNAGLDPELVQGALACMVHLNESGELVLAVPVDDNDNDILIDELRDILSLYAASVNVTDAFIRYLKSRLENRKYKKGVGLSSFSKSLIYPTYVPRIIPFIKDVNVMRNVYESVMNNYRNYPNNFSRQIRASLYTILEDFNLVRKINGIQYLADLMNVKVYVEVIVSEFDEKLIEMYSYDQPSCVLVFIPQELLWDPRKWNVFVYRMQLTDMLILAARTALYEHLKEHAEQHIDPDALREFYNNIVEKYGLDRINYEWREKAREKGVFVSNTLGIEQLPIVARSQRKAFAILSDYCRTILSCGNKVDMRELEELLFKLYCIRPIGIEFTPLIDIEPNNPKYLMYDKNFRGNVKSLIESSKDLLNRAGMLEIEDSILHLKLHPIEERIINILKTYEKLDLESLAGHFVFEDESAKQNIFNDLFIKLLERRGYIVLLEEGSRKRKAKVVALLKDVEALEEVSLKLAGLVRRVEETLRELGFGISSPVNHIILAKKHGWKLILLRDVVETARSFMELFEKTHDPAVAITLRYLHNYLEILFNDFIFNSINEIKRFKLSIEDKMRVIESEMERIRSSISDVKEIISEDAYRTITEQLDRTSKALMEYSGIILKWLDNILSMSEEELVKNVDAAKDNIINMFSFGGKNEFFNNFIVYKIRKECSRQFESISQNIEKLSKVNNLLLSIRQKLNQLSSEERIKLSNLMKSRGPVRGTIQNIDGIVVFLDEIRRHFDATLGELQRVERKRKELKERFNMMLNELYNQKSQLENGMNRLSVISRSADKLKEVVKGMSDVSISIDGVYQEMKQLFDRLSDISRNLESFGSQFEVSDVSILEDNVSSLRNELNVLRNKIEELLRQTNYLYDKVSRECKSFANEVIDDLRRKKELLIKLRAETSLLIKMNEIEDKLSRLAELFPDPGAADEFTKLIDEKRSLDSQFVKITSERLGRDRYLVYNVLRNRFRLSERRLSDLVSSVAEETALRDSEVLEHLLMLDKEGLVKIKLVVD